MNLIGLPDFHAPFADTTAGGWGHAYWPFGGGARCYLAPDSLKLATRPDGSADFRLELIRPFAPGLPPVPHGALDMSVATENTGFDRALAALREQSPDASLEPLAASSGSFRFVAASSDACATLLEPVALTGHGLRTLRLLRQLPLDDALLLRTLLAQGASSISALVEFACSGVAPRLPLRAHFDAPSFLQALGAVKGRRVTVVRDDIAARIQAGRDGLELTMTIAGDAGLLNEPGAALDFADAVCDLVRQRFGRGVWSMGPAPRASFELPALDEIPKTTVEWDLAQPTLATRSFILPLDAFAALGAVARREGIASLVTETTIPPIPLGTVTFDVFANLPPARIGLRLIGADVIAPAHPPSRPDALVRTATFDPPDDKSCLAFQLSPQETSSFTVRPFVWRDGPSGPERLDGVDRLATGGMLTLGVDDFPVLFVPVEAAQELLALAAVRSTCRWNTCAKPLEAMLSPGAPAAAFAVPPGVTDAVIEFEATSLADAGKALVLAPQPARPLQLGLASFPQFGAHCVTITMALTQGVAVAALDLCPEGLPDDPTNLTTLAFTRESPTHAWSWFAASPFTPGYRWRRHVGSGRPGAWSAVQTPFAALSVAADQAFEVPA